MYSIRVCVYMNCYKFREKNNTHEFSEKAVDLYDVKPMFNPLSSC